MHKKNGFSLLELLVAAGILVVAVVFLFAYRGAIAAKIRQLRGIESAPVVVTTPTPTPTSPITPLPTSSFPASGATASPGSIAKITPAPGKPGDPLPTSGPAEMLVVLGVAAAAASAGHYAYMRRKSQL